MGRFIECPSCGRPMRLDEPRCRYCGAANTYHTSGGGGAGRPPGGQQPPAPPAPTPAPHQGGDYRATRRVAQPGFQRPYGGGGYNPQPRRPQRGGMPQWAIYAIIAVVAAIVCSAVTFGIVTWSKAEERKEFVADSIRRAQEAIELREKYVADSTRRAEDSIRVAAETRARFVKLTELVKVGNRTVEDYYGYTRTEKVFGFGDVVRALKNHGYEQIDKTAGSDGFTTYVYAINAAWRSGMPVPVADPCSVVTIYANSERVWRVKVSMESETARAAFMRQAGALGMSGSVSEGYYGEGAVDDMCFRVTSEGNSVLLTLDWYD